MRQLLTNISTNGTNNICQVITLIVRNEVVRPLRAYLPALRWYASRLSDDMRGAAWQGLGMAACAAKQPARGFVTAKQHERHVRVTRRRSVA